MCTRTHNLVPPHAITPCAPPPSHLHLVAPPSWLPSVHLVAPCSCVVSPHLPVHLLQVLQHTATQGDSVRPPTPAYVQAPQPIVSRGAVRDAVEEGVAAVKALAMQDVKDFLSDPVRIEPWGGIWRACQDLVLKGGPVLVLVPGEELGPS